jgi:hypothetical protein
VLNDAHIALGKAIANTLGIVPWRPSFGLRAGDLPDTCSTDPDTWPGRTVVFGRIGRVFGVGRPPARRHAS